MKTREQIINSMCYTMRHDFGLDRDDKLPVLLSSGLTEKERSSLWNNMAQLFDNDIAPYMEFKSAK